jgi:hypothetical protein
MTNKRFFRARLTPVNSQYWQALKYALTLKEFEAQDIWDWIAIPYYLLRFFFAWIWTTPWVWGLRFNLWWRWRTGKMMFSFLPIVGGRWDDPFPVICNRCMWAGMTRWLSHGYADCGDGDVEAEDECPKCGNQI